MNDNLSKKWGFANLHLILNEF